MLGVVLADFPLCNGGFFFIVLNAFISWHSNTPIFFQRRYADIIGIANKNITLHLNSQTRLRAK